MEPDETLCFSEEQIDRIAKGEMANYGSVQPDSYAEKDGKKSAFLRGSDNSLIGSIFSYDGWVKIITLHKNHKRTREIYKSSIRITVEFPDYAKNGIADQGFIGEDGWSKQEPVIMHYKGNFLEHIVSVDCALDMAKKNIACNLSLPPLIKIR